ncbi:hypothetical protein [Pseudarthrobacter sp. NIBRBAC000502770]|uniref:hypothetical protein n=1 Tax=Pseudarthrobacter sp. NIBRBAC000502770 TaxID=2590785 RepID=UPI0011402128|nr:hypothetical protein [Pseudarthrobacter sp. NIBRBAC000502770]QDG87068.1 hypothetical protein NIBR502770_00115 [Pseudarthrobacter sp. NIBRBAC000502770]
MVSSEFLSCFSRTPLLQTVMQCDPITVIVNAPQQNAGDPSTLLATLSQASAVLVAIIGGFLVSRLVAISSEREGLRRLLAAASGRISHVQSDLDDARKVRLGRAQRDFHDEAVDKFLEDPELDLDEMLHDFVPRGTTEEELKPYALELRERTVQAVKDIKAAFRRGDTRELDLEDLVARGLSIDTDRDLYESAFEHLRKRLPSPPGMFGGAFDHRSLIAGITPPWVHEVNARRADEALRAESDLSTQLKSAIAERSRLNDELVRVGKPLGVLSAIWMLGVLSLLGILVPVVVMALEPDALANWAKVGLIVSFVVGLLAILGYVVWFWRKIGANEEQTVASE